MIQLLLIKTALFIHVVCTATLLGGLSLIVMFLRDATRSNQASILIDRIQKIQHWNKAMMVPVSGLALVSGIYMLFQYAQKPTWLLIKERFGSLFLFLFIVLVLTYGKKLVQKIEGETEFPAMLPFAHRYIRLLNFAILYMIAMIFVVTFKI